MHVELMSVDRANNLLVNLKTNKEKSSSKVSNLCQI